MDFTALGITPETLAYVYAWGVASVLGLFTLGYATGAAVSAVKRL
jgi:hypothetical protein